jgi:hypothetical protein
MHLNAADLIDLAEGARPESSVPHLAECARCRQQLLELRDMMDAAAGASDVPEPSPLFWDHLSKRVHLAVAEDAGARRGWRDRLAWRRGFLPASAVALAAALIVGVVTWRAPAPPPASVGSASTQAALSPVPAVAGADLLDDGADDDDSLILVADLSAAADADELSVEPAVSAEHAVIHLNGDELRELQRLLQQELTPSGV